MANPSKKPTTFREDWWPAGQARTTSLLNLTWKIPRRMGLYAFLSIKNFGIGLAFTIIGIVLFFPSLFTKKWSNPDPDNMHDGIAFKTGLMRNGVVGLPFRAVALILLSIFTLAASIVGALVLTPLALVVSIPTLIVAGIQKASKKQNTPRKALPHSTLSRVHSAFTPPSQNTQQKLSPSEPPNTTPVSYVIMKTGHCVKHSEKTMLGINCVLPQDFPIYQFQAMTKSQVHCLCASFDYKPSQLEIQHLGCIPWTTCELQVEIKSSLQANGQDIEKDELLKTKIDLLLNAIAMAQHVFKRDNPGLADANGKPLQSFNKMDTIFNHPRVNNFLGKIDWSVPLDRRYKASM